MKDIPVLLNHDPNRVIGVMNIYDEDFANILRNTPTDNGNILFEFGWCTKVDTKEIVEVSLNPQPVIERFMEKETEKKCMEQRRIVDYQQFAQNLEILYNHGPNAKIGNVIDIVETPEGISITYEKLKKEEFRPPLIKTDKTRTLINDMFNAINTSGVFKNTAVDSFKKDHYEVLKELDELEKTTK